MKYSLIRDILLNVFIGVSSLGRSPMGEANGRTEALGHSPTGEAFEAFNRMHYVYVLKSKKDNNLYIGCTEDLNRRLVYHNSGKVRSTKSRLPFELLYFEEYYDKYEAFYKERFYKTIKGKKELVLKIK